MSAPMAGMISAPKARPARRIFVMGSPLLCGPSLKLLGQSGVVAAARTELRREHADAAAAAAAQLVDPVEDVDDVETPRDRLVEQAVFPELALEAGIERHIGRNM